MVGVSITSMGLKLFKAKFRPDAWEPITVISNEKRLSLQALHAVAAAFSTGPPIGAILRAMWAAVKQELLWIVSGRSERRKVELRSADPSKERAAGNEQRDKRS